LTPQDRNDSVDSVFVTIEAAEDLSIRPWQGKIPLDKQPFEASSTGTPEEALHTLVADQEDPSVRPRPHGSESEKTWTAKPLGTETTGARTESPEGSAPGA